MKGVFYLLCGVYLLICLLSQIERKLNCVQPEIPLFCVSQVVKVVQQMLRSLNPNPVGDESLRLYILLPELIRRLKKQQRTELTEALASKILQLDPDAHKVLGMEDLSAFVLLSLLYLYFYKLVLLCYILREELDQTPWWLAQKSGEVISESICWADWPDFSW